MKHRLNTDNSTPCLNTGLFGDLTIWRLANDFMR